MKMAQAKVIIWSLVILIQCDKLSNHRPHADKVYVVKSVCQFHFRQLTVHAPMGSPFCSRNHILKRVCFVICKKPQLDHVLKNVILI